MVHRASSILVLLTVLAATSGCGSSSSTVTSPTTLTRCAVTLTGSSSVPASGGGGTVNVSAARECAWTAGVEGPWLTIRSGASGQGAGLVEFAAAANPDPAVRRGAVVLNGERLEISQAAGECTISLAESSAAFPQSGGTGRVDVRASSGMCRWSARSEAEWITLRSGEDGAGSAAVAFDVGPSTTGRVGSLRIAGHRFEVRQTTGCTYALAPSSHTAGMAGGSGTIALTTAPGCPWTAMSDAGWLTFAPQEGSGPATITFTVAPSGTSRNATGTIGGQAFSVTQSAAPQNNCTYSAAPLAHTVSSAGGVVTVQVSTGAPCAWSAASDVPWITLNSPGTSAGPGSATFTVAPGASRSATVRVADHAVTITQRDGCTYALSSESAAINAAGGSGTVDVSAGSGCPWSASSSAVWLTIRSGASGEGGGTVRFDAAANTGAARTGTLTIAGRAFTVTQAAAASSCSASIAPDARSLAAAGGAFQVAVSTGAQCGWSASSGASWIVVQPASGSGSGNVEVVVAANTGGARTGTATIAGRTLTVTQAAAAVCEYEISPREREVGREEREIEVKVRTARGCGWTAVSRSLWITVVSGASGSGEGEVELQVQRNDGERRRGEVSIAGETFTLVQKAAKGRDDDDDDDDDD